MDVLLSIPRKLLSSVCVFSRLGVIAAFAITLGGAQQVAGPAAVVVEEAGKGTVASDAGLLKGDVISGWISSTGQSSGVTPFDLIEIEVELAPRGPVTLKGWRDDREMTWKVIQGRWGLKARPLLPRPLLIAYEEGRKRLESKDYNAAAAAWREAASLPESANPVWLAPWLLSSGAETLAEARQWPQTDEIFQMALDRAVARATCARRYSNRGHRRTIAGTGRKPERTTNRPSKFAERQNRPPFSPSIADSHAMNDARPVGVITVMAYWAYITAILWRKYEYEGAT